jgi:hypothetical protein
MRAGKGSGAGRHVMPDEFLADANWDLIPQTLREPIRRYVADGIVPNSFLIGVLSNDLVHAVMIADETNLRRLADIVRFCFNYLPRECWGSGERIAYWEHLGGFNARLNMAPFGIMGSEERVSR